MVWWKKLLWIISVVMSLSGAVNAGNFGVLPALPFMGYLLYWGYKLGRRYLVGVVVFVSFCVVINVTQDMNPLLYPVLNGGKLIVKQDALYTDYEGSLNVILLDQINLLTGNHELTPAQQAELDNFLQDHTVRMETNPSFLPDGALAAQSGIQARVGKLYQGEQYPILRVYHGGSGFIEEIGVVTEIGHFRVPSPVTDAMTATIYSVNTDVIQAPWAHYLSTLMYYPIAPLYFFFESQDRSDDYMGE